MKLFFINNQTPTNKLFNSLRISQINERKCFWEKEFLKRWFLSVVEMDDADRVSGVCVFVLFHFFFLLIKILFFSVHIILTALYTAIDHHFGRNKIYKRCLFVHQPFEFVFLFSVIVSVWWIYKYLYVHII